MLVLISFLCDLETSLQSVALLSLYLIFFIYRKYVSSTKYNQESQQLMRTRLEVAQQYLNTYATENEDYFMVN